MFFFSTCSLNLNETSLVSQMLCFCTHFPYHVSPASDYVKLKTVRWYECYLNVPEPQLRAVVRSTGYQVGVIGTPG